MFKQNKSFIVNTIRLVHSLKFGMQQNVCNFTLMLSWCSFIVHVQITTTWPDNYRLLTAALKNIKVSHSLCISILKEDGGSNWKRGHFDNITLPLIMKHFLCSSNAFCIKALLIALISLNEYDCFWIYIPSILLFPGHKFFIHTPPCHAWCSVVLYSHLDPLSFPFQ